LSAKDLLGIAIAQRHVLDRGKVMAAKLSALTPLRAAIQSTSTMTLLTFGLVKHLITRMTIFMASKTTIAPNVCLTHTADGEAWIHPRAQTHYLMSRP
jgi:hypothetical protein